MRSSKDQSEMMKAGIAGENRFNKNDASQLKCKVKISQEESSEI